MRAGALGFAVESRRTPSQWLCAPKCRSARLPISHDGRVTDDATVACGFCGRTVEDSEQDPIAIGVVEQWQPGDEEPDWMLYAHRNCLLSALQPEFREPFP